jgi:hypothetical protein
MAIRQCEVGARQVQACNVYLHTIFAMCVCAHKYAYLRSRLWLSDDFDHQLLFEYPEVLVEC